MSDTIPPLHPEEVAIPRTETAAYFSDGRPAWGTDHARPATSETRALQLEIADLKRRLIGMTQVATDASRDCAAALDREGEALDRAEDAEAQLELARAITLRLLRRPQQATVEAAMDRAARSVTGRPHPELAAYLDQQVASYPVETPDDRSEWISRALAAARYDLSRKLVVVRQFVALADLVEHWLTLERKMDVAERTPGRGASYGLVESLDAVQITLARAVRR